MSDKKLLPAVVTAVRAAGYRVRQRFAEDARPGSLEEILDSLRANDDTSLEVLREALRRIRPGAGWVDDELAGSALPAGEWWVTDPVEGNINHVHGLADWAVTATLVRDNEAVLTVVHLPLTGDLYTAIRGEGAWHNGIALRASTKTSLDAAFVATGQARPGEDALTLRRIGESITAMLGAALVARMSVPATLQLVQLAAGRLDVFWQYSDVRSGLLAGALLAREAGGVVTDTHGRPWQPGAADFLASAPAVHRAAVDVLTAVA